VSNTWGAAGVALPSLVGGAGRELRLSNTDRAVEDAGGTLTTYTYDENGNTVAVNAAGSRTTMTWSYEDEMLVAEPATGGRVTMVYDGDFMRRKREEGASTAKYLWDGAQVLMETDGSDTTQARYTLAPFGYGDLVSQRRGDDSHFFHFDAIGTTRGLTDADQAVTDSYLHRAFGTYVSTTGDTLNYFRYLGKLGYYQDSASPDGGFYVRRRYYAAGLGRFLSRDPVREAGVSAYEYVRNWATRATDPSGWLVGYPLDPWIFWAICFAATLACGKLVATAELACTVGLVVPGACELALLEAAAACLTALAVCAYYHTHYPPKPILEIQPCFGPVCLHPVPITVPNVPFTALPMPPINWPSLPPVPVQLLPPVPLFPGCPSWPPASVLGPPLQRVGRVVGPPLKAAGLEVLDVLTSGSGSGGGGNQNPRYE